MKRRLWYNSWTEEYIEGLPVGNGRLAAMMLGTPGKLRIALNHEWMWRGESRFREHPDVSGHLPEIRQALLEGDFLKGTALANEYLGGLGGVSGKRGRVDPYVPVGDIWVETDAGDAAGYKRTLDLDTGLAETSFTAPSGKISEKLFISCTNGCGAAEVTSEKPADFIVSLSRKEDTVCTVSLAAMEDGILLKGAFNDGIKFEAAVRVETDGFVEITDGRIAVRGATRLTLLIQIVRMPKAVRPPMNLSGRTVSILHLCLPVMLNGLLP